MRVKAPQTLNVVDIVGQGQVGSSFVTSVTTTREFTITFREYQNMPVLNVIRQWAAIFDPFTGVSPLKGNEFIPVNYKGWCVVMQTKPVNSQDSNFAVEDVEECYIYQGVQVTNIPVDTAAASDVTANDTVQLSATFRFDGAPMTSGEVGVTENVVSLFNDLRYLGSEDSTFEQYLRNSQQIKPWTSPGDDVGSEAQP